MNKIYGPGNYKELANRIEQDGLKLAPMGETVSSIHPAYKGLFSFLPFGQRGQVRRIMRNNFFYAFTDVHNFPGNVVFYHDFSQLKDRFQSPTQKELETMLGSKEEKGVIFSDDDSLRMVAGKYRTGELKKTEFSSHPNIMGQTGSLRSAYELGEIASVHKYNPHLWLNVDINEPITTVSALNSNWGLDSRLNVGGNYRGNYVDGCAFGVKDKTGEASRAESYLRIPTS